MTKPTKEELERAERFGERGRDELVIVRDKNGKEKKPKPRRKPTN